jgi:hypothetical protein
MTILDHSGNHPSNHKESHKTVPISQNSISLADDGQTGRIRDLTFRNHGLHLRLTSEQEKSVRPKSSKHTNSGRNLNEEWEVGALHALYHQDGTFYQHLNTFPGALFDRDGYVVFATESSYRSAAGLHHGQKLNVPGGISSLTGYTRKR